MRVLLDTNLFVSYLLAPDSETPVPRTVRAALDKAFILLVTDRSLAELDEVLAHKPYLVAHIGSASSTAFLELVKRVAEWVPLPDNAVPRVVRDPKDDYLLAAAIAGQADYLVTGDGDLLALAGLVQVAIVSPAAFVQVLAEQGV